MASWLYLSHVVWCEPFQLPFPERAETPLFTCWDRLFLVSSQGVSCLLFYDFLITSHGSLWELTATRLPAEFYIRDWEEWIIKSSHLEIMKRSKMPMLIAQGAVGIIGGCYCYLLNIIVGCEMWFAGVRYTGRKPLGPQGHANKQVISTKHMQHDKHIYSEPVKDEHGNMNGHSTGHTSIHSTHTHNMSWTSYRFFFWWKCPVFFPEWVKTLWTTFVWEVER